MKDKKCPVLYGLYIHRSSYGWGDGSYHSDWLEGADIDKDALRARYNAPIIKTLAELDKKKSHESCYRGLSPLFEDGEEKLKYNGSTGGGYSRVDYVVEIKLLEQKIWK